MANVPELYNPAANTWVELPRLAQSTPPGLYPQAVVGPNGKVFVVKNARQAVRVHRRQHPDLDHRHEVSARPGRRQHRDV